MKNILAPAQRPILEPFAWSRTLLAFDFDGTLAPIVARPDRAALRPSTKRLLSTLATLYPCVVISGRAASDVSGRLKDISLRGVIGNHGLEPWRATAVLSRRVRAWKPLLHAALRDEAGVEIEDKGYSIAVHFRRSRAKKRVRRRILEAAATLEGVRLIRGIEVLNLIPAGSPHKGIALERERQRLACDTAIYVGDDETDEDVFALDQPGRLLSIRVGRKEASAADFYLETQSQIDSLLRTLIRLRRDSRALVDILAPAS